MLRALEDELDKNASEGPRGKALKKYWQSAWKDIDVVGDKAYYKILGYWNRVDLITVTDVGRMNDELQFKLRCQDVAAIYNAHSGAKKACVEFVCEKGAKSTKPGRKPLPPKEDLHGPFK